MDKTAIKEIDSKLWEEYQETHSPRIRNKILMAYLDIVKINARKMQAVYKNHAELEDIVNQGVIALIDCIDKYDYRRGVQFDSYASIRVRGSIIDYIRKQDWVPRSIRKKSIDIERACMDLQNELSRAPTDDELAARMGMQVEEMNHMIGEMQGFMVLSYEELLQDNLDDSEEHKSSIKTPEQVLQTDELKRVIANSIDELSEKEKTVISLYYYEELKLKEIAFVLGLTESRISQLHSKALMKLKCRVGGYMRE